jgi:hypothetical protein
MPTARELLEQADALMRRNRQDAGVRAPAPARTEPDGPPLAMPAAVPAAAPANSPVRREEPSIPVLDAVVAPRTARTVDDDFPVLTDAVDEIEVALPVEAEGEASDWLVEPTGDDESVLGPAPPSVAVVPPSTLLRTPGTPVSAAPVPVARSQPVDLPAPVRAPPPPLERFEIEPEPIDEPEITIARIAPIPATTGPASAAAVPSAPASSARAELAAIEDLSALDGDEPDITLTHPSTFAAAEPPPPAPARDAQWEAMAEEIRMQVLQRIDMFTDTGLSERLGERLKPIVDRASDDLVKAINQHVGELLRAYVAEAIEREIDRWRAGR